MNLVKLGQGGLGKRCAMVTLKGWGEDLVCMLGVKLANHLGTGICLKNSDFLKFFFFVPLSDPPEMEHLLGMIIFWCYIKQAASPR